MNSPGKSMCSCTGGEAGTCRTALCQLLPVGRVRGSQRLRGLVLPLGLCPPCHQLSVTAPPGPPEVVFAVRALLADVSWFVMSHVCVQQLWSEQQLRVSRGSRAWETTGKLSFSRGKEAQHLPLALGLLLPEHSWPITKAEAAF